MNPLIKEFGIQLKMALSFQSLKRMDLLLKNFGPNGPMKNVRWRLDCIAQDIIASALDSNEFFGISE